jgi:hypothetical protein
MVSAFEWLFTKTKEVLVDQQYWTDVLKGATILAEIQEEWIRALNWERVEVLIAFRITGTCGRTIRRTEALLGKIAKSY